MAEERLETRARKIKYRRPTFLNLPNECITYPINFAIRPVMIPPIDLPYNAGYAECVNNGVTKFNEDQASVYIGELKADNIRIPYGIFGLFDGHRSTGAAILCAKHLDHIIHRKLCEVPEDIWVLYVNPEERIQSVKEAICEAYDEMDNLIRDYKTSDEKGGCTAMVAVFIFGHVFVANAGNSKGLICSRTGFKIISTEFTVNKERQRILQVAVQNPEVLGTKYTTMEYREKRDISQLEKLIFYRKPLMIDWKVKLCELSDLKTPLISGDGLRTLLGSAHGLSRGLGDHNLLSKDNEISLKPFILSRPEIQVFNLNNHINEVLIMGTDGLWPSIDNKAGAIIYGYNREFCEDKNLCKDIAFDMVFQSRGFYEGNNWVRTNDENGSLDDISVFVIPLNKCLQQYQELGEELSTPRGTE